MRQQEKQMRTPLALVLVVLAAATTAAPALGRDQALKVDTRHVSFVTVTAPESGITSDAILVTNVSGQPVAMTYRTTIDVPTHWGQDWLPFIVEDAVLLPNWDSCDVIPPGATCAVFVTFQTDRPGTFAGWLRINGTDWVELHGRAVPEVV
jgi:hypothetical protein